MKRLALLTGAALLGGLLLTGPAATQKSNDVYRELDLFGSVFERVRSSYVDKVTDEKLIEAAINGMLRSLDPHSSYMNAETFCEMQVQTSGEFGGLGIEVTMEKGVIKVVSPIDDTPAARAGIQSGDLITHIDGKPILGMTLRDAVKKMRGRVGTKIVVRIRRGEAEPFDVTIERAVITVKSVRYRREGNIGYVRITSFTEQTTVGLREALRSFTMDGKKVTGVILDLRNNPGGLLGEAVSVSDAFLDRGEIVSTRGRDGKITSRFNATKGDLAEGLPVIVLINGGSASASEIVAGALQDHKRAIILGTQSFGKGSVQTIIPLSNRGAMRLTTARYYTPSGRSIQAKGVSPDINVPQAKLEAVKQPGLRREKDLPNALDTDKSDEKDKSADAKKPDATKPDATKPDATKPDATKKDESQPAVKATTPQTAQDYQLQRAVDLLRALALIDERRKSAN